MKYSAEQLEKAKNAASAEELLALAKEENIEMTVEEASKLFDMLHSEGDLPDEALDDVAGGCGKWGEYGGYETNLWKKSVYFWDHVGKDDAVVGQVYGITFDNGEGWIIGKMENTYKTYGDNRYHTVTATRGGGSEGSLGIRTLYGNACTLYKHAKDWNTGEILL